MSLSRMSAVGTVVLVVLVVLVVAAGGMVLVVVADVVVVVVVVVVVDVVELLVVVGSGGAGPVVSVNESVKPAPEVGTKLAVRRASVARMSRKPFVGRELLPDQAAK